MYKIFNPLTGLHETAQSLEEAKQLKLQYITDYLNVNMNMFSIAYVEVDQENNETWSLIELNEEVICSFKPEQI